MKKIIIASTSTLHGRDYLDYLLPTLQDHFKGCSSLLFIPYARPGGISHDTYTDKAREFFAKLGITVTGIHEHEDPIKAVEEAQALFTGGGNTFVLVSQLYKAGVLTALEKAVKKGHPTWAPVRAAIFAA